MRPDAADRFLRSVRDARIEQRRCEHRLSELETAASRVTARWNDSPTTGGGDVHKDDLMISIADQADRLLRLSADLLHRIALVEEFIGRIDDPRHRTVLRLRYVDGLRWENVVREMESYGLYYVDRSVYRLHDDAIDRARELFPAFAEKYPEISEEEEDK